MSFYNVPVVSGGFDPIHSGHIALIDAAAHKYEMGVVVLLNSDDWLTRKKGRPFLPFDERKKILLAMRSVHSVLGFDDSDNTACDGLNKLKTMLGPNIDLIFCNGGDRNADNIPEMNIPGIKFDFGIGGDDKKNSSSVIIKNALYTEQRIWGSFTDLYRTEGCRVKELIIKPGMRISYQKHKHRSEVWYVHKGKGKITLGNDPNNPLIKTTFDIDHNRVQIIPCGYWHKIWNDGDEDLIIIEIQYGDYIGEDDIIRLKDV